MDLSYYEFIQHNDECINAKHLYTAIEHDFDFSMFFKRYNIYYNRGDKVLSDDSFNDLLNVLEKRNNTNLKQEARDEVSATQ